MRRGLCFFAAFSALQALAVFFLPLSWLPWLALAALLGSLPLFLLRRRRAVCLLLGAALGCLCFLGFHALQFAPAQALSGRRCALNLRLSEYPEAMDYGARVEGYAVGHGAVPFKVLFYGPEELLDLKPGDQVTATADCALADTLYGKPVYFYTSRGVFLRATARGALHVQPSGGVPWWAWPALCRHKLQEGIAAAFPADTAPLMTALVSGDQSFLEEGQYFDLTRAGVAHIVTVSGLHLCFLVGLAGALTGWDPKRRAAVCIPVMVLFVLMVGARPPVVRAAIMQTILLLAPLLRREGDWATSLLCALALLLLFDPYAIANIGLQLSFAAVVGIRLLGTPLSAFLGGKLPHPRRRWSRVLRALGRTLTGTFSTTLGATVFTLPLSLFYFDTLSLAAPLANLLVVPIVGVLFAAGLLLGLLALPLPGLAAFLGHLFAPLGRYVLAVTQGLAALPYGAVTMTDLYYPVFVLALYVLLGLWFWFRRRSKKRPDPLSPPPRLRVFLSGALALLLAALSFTHFAGRGGRLTVTVLDVGQGQSVALFSGGRTCLVDCGGNSLTDPGDVAANYLLDRGERTVDLLVLTHFHEDHAGGVATLFRRLNIRAVAIPDTDRESEAHTQLLDLARAEGAQVRYITENTVLPLGRTDLTLYPPLGDGGANEEGLSLVAQAGDFRLLLTGDMTTEVEETLVDHAGLAPCDVLVVGHHGSRNATGTTLLDAARPETAVISVGRNNYGHPSEETLTRLTRRGVALYRTDLQGSITFQVG